MPPNFSPLPTKIRKDPLGHITLNTMARNTVLLDQLARVEHTPDGNHNSLMIARTGGRLTYAAGYTATVWDAYASLAGGHSPATGTIIITLAAGKFSAPGLLVMTSVADAEVANKPHIVGVLPSTDGSTVTLYVKYLSSALGAGNSWAAVDMTVDFAVFSSPWDGGASGLLEMPVFERYDGLPAEDGWNTMVDNIARVQERLSTEHNILGDHTIVHVPRAMVLAKYDGATFDILDRVGIASVTQLSTGVSEVTLQDALTDIRAFVSPEYSRDNGGSAGALWVTNCRATSTTTIEVYSYLYDAGGDTWDLADNDFFLVVHGEP